MSTSIENLKYFEFYGLLDNSVELRAGMSPTDVKNDGFITDQDVDPRVVSDYLRKLADAIDASSTTIPVAIENGKLIVAPPGGNAMAKPALAATPEFGNAKLASTTVEPTRKRRAKPKQNRAKKPKSKKKVSSKTEKKVKKKKT